MFDGLETWPVKTTSPEELIKPYLSSVPPKSKPAYKLWGIVQIRWYLSAGSWWLGLIFRVAVFFSAAYRFFKILDSLTQGFAKFWKLPGSKDDDDN
jgi:hypothetical protein